MFLVQCGENSEQNKDGLLPLSVMEENRVELLESSLPDIKILEEQYECPTRSITASVGVLSWLSDR